ncbi:MAG: presenilin family intramembrane aspartyl protease PSH [Candidatus Thermoplasmatota archaeon]
MKKEINLKKDVLPVFLMGGLFVLIQGIALFLVTPFRSAGMQAFENPDNPINIVYILVIMLVFTLAVLAIAKFWKKNVIQLFILAAIGYTSAYVFYPLLGIAFSDFPTWFLYHNDNLLFTLSIPDVLSIFLAVILVYTLYKYPEWYVIDFTGVVVGAGAIAIFGISLSVLLVLILLIALAVYDAISVYKTKHMVDLADTVMELKLPVLLVVPKIRDYSLIEETKSLKKKIEGKEERDAFFIGLGDIVMPGILVVAAYVNIANGLPIAIGTMSGTLAGFSVLMTFVIKGNPQAGLPSLCGGAILGYLISSLLIFGEIKGLVLPF